MKVTYTYDINDVFEENNRVANSQINRLFDRVVDQVLWLFLVVPTIGWTYFTLGHPSTYGFVLAGVGFAGMVGQWYWAQRRRTHVFEYLERICGGPGPYRCEVELTNDGVVKREFDAEIRRPWTSVEAVKDTPAGVELSLGHRGNILVRSNAFMEVTARDAFVRAANEHLRRARET